MSAHFKDRFMKQFHGKKVSCKYMNDILTYGVMGVEGNPTEGFSVKMGLVKDSFNDYNRNSSHPKEFNIAYNNQGHFHIDNPNILITEPDFVKWLSVWSSSMFRGEKYNPNQAYNPNHKIFFEEMKKLNELNLDTYAKTMDSTESYPWSSDKNISSKKGKINNLARERFEAEWNKLYLNKTISFIGQSGKTFDLAVCGIKFNTNYTNFDILLDASSIGSSGLVFIKNPLYMDGLSKDKFPEPVKLSKQSANDLKAMFHYGLGKQHTDKNHIGENVVSLTDKIIKEAQEY